MLFLQKIKEKFLAVLWNRNGSFFYATCLLVQWYCPGPRVVKLFPQATFVTWPIPLLELFLNFWSTETKLINDYCYFKLQKFGDICYHQWRTDTGEVWFFKGLKRYGMDMVRYVPGSSNSLMGQEVYCRAVTQCTSWSRRNIYRFQLHCHKEGRVGLKLTGSKLITYTSLRSNILYETVIFDWIFGKHFLRKHRKI